MNSDKLESIIEDNSIRDGFPKQTRQSSELLLLLESLEHLNEQELKDALLNLFIVITTSPEGQQIQSEEIILDKISKVYFNQEKAEQQTLCLNILISLNCRSIPHPQDTNAEFLCQTLIHSLISPNKATCEASCRIIIDAAKQMKKIRLILIQRDCLIKKAVYILKDGYQSSSSSSQPQFEFTEHTKMAVLEILIQLALRRNLDWNQEETNELIDILQFISENNINSMKTENKNKNKNNKDDNEEEEEDQQEDEDIETVESKAEQLLVILKQKVCKQEQKRKKSQSPSDQEEHNDIIHGSNLYIEGIPNDFTDDQLRELFYQFGKIILCVVLHSDGEYSSKFGFCGFETEESAQKAKQEMNGFQIGQGGSRLIVDYAQNMEQRQSLHHIRDKNSRDGNKRIYNKFYDNKTLNPFQDQIQNLLKLMQIFPPLPQNIGQNPLIQIPPYQFGGSGQIPQYILPNMRMNQQFPFPGMNPNLINYNNNLIGGMMNQQGNNRIGNLSNPQLQNNRINDWPYPPTQIPNPILQQQLPHNIQIPNINQHQIQTPIIPQQPITNLVIQPIQPPQIQQTFEQQVLDDLPPHEKKYYIGELLYEKISIIDQRNAGKITGMFLDLEIPELIILLREDQKLNRKISELQ